MTVKQVVAALNEIMRDLHTEVLNVPENKLIVSCYGRVLAIAKTDRVLPLRALIEEGPDLKDRFWVAVDSLPDWKNVLVDSYKLFVKGS